MPRHTPPQASVCHVCGALVADSALHDSWHAPTGAGVPRLRGRDYEDNADTVSLPPVRDSIGPRRRPPAIVADLLHGAELTRALLAELAAYEDQESGE